MNKIETFLKHEEEALKNTEEAIVDRYESQNITIMELGFHYPTLEAAIKNLFLENDPPKRVPDDTVIPFSREKCAYLSSIIKKMWELKYKGPNMIRPQDVAVDFIKSDFPWNDYSEISGLDELKEFIQWFKDHFDTLAIDEP